MYGKDKASLEKIAAYGNVNGGSMRQRAALLRQNLENTRGGGGSTRYSDLFKPSKTESDLVRIIPGNYTYTGANPDDTLYETTLPYWPYVEHFHSTKQRGFACSAGPLGHRKGKAEPCEGCARFFGDMTKDGKGKTKFGPVSRREMIAFTVLHMAPYHKIEQSDGQGNIKKNDKGEAYYNWVPCTQEKDCEMCKARKETRPGHLMYWPMGVSHFKSLTEEYDPLIGESCAACGSRDSMYTEQWICGNPECQDTVIDEHSTLTKKDKAAMVAAPVTCPTCKQKVFLDEVVACKKCPSGRRATIFDVDLKVKRAVTGKDGSNQTTLMVTGWSDPSDWWGNHDNIPVEFKEIARPLDLPKLPNLAPPSIEDQKKKFDGQEAGNSNFAPYQR